MEWSEVELEVLGEGVKYAPFVRSVHRSYRRAYVMGGGVVVCCVALWLGGVLRSGVGLSGFQVALGCGLAVLVGLGVARRFGEWRGGRLRERVWEFCAREGVGLEVLCDVARRMGTRWIFFVRLWDDFEETKEAG